MAFTPQTKNAGDLIKSADWNDAMNAILGLVAKFNKTTGHMHKGGTDDAPLITESAIAANAVTTAKISDNAVTSEKILNGAVKATEIADAAIITAKIANGAVTAEKIAAGVVPELRIAIASSVANGASIPPPAGTNKSECVFFAFPKLLAVPRDEAVTFNCYCDAAGKVTAVPADKVVAAGVAIWKKGGW